MGKGGKLLFSVFVSCIAAVITTTSLFPMSLFSTSIFSIVFCLSLLVVSIFFLGILGIGTCGWICGGLSGSSRLLGGGFLSVLGSGCPYCNENGILSVVIHFYY